MAKWYKVGKGLQAYNHESRKYGKRFDRYFRGRYMVDGKMEHIPFGWESEFSQAEKSRVENDGGIGKRSLLEYATGELERLKANAKAGAGPATLKEERELAEIQKREEDRARAAEKEQSLTFGQFFSDNYLPIAKTHKKNTTMAEEESVFKVWLKPYLGKIRLRDWRPLHLEKLKRAMLKEGKSPRRIQYVMAISRQVWNMARNQGIVSGDWPGRGVKIPKFDNRRMRFLSPQESELLLSELKERSQQTHDIALVSLDCGLRFGEIVKLQLGHINIPDGIIMVVDPKATENRAAFMTSRVQEMFQSMPMGKKTDLVFKDTNGEPIKKISHSFFRAVDALHFNDDVEDRRARVVFHSLRHSFASNLMSNGASLYEVSQLLGHADVTMAARYSHLGAGSLRAAVQRMEAATSLKATAEVIPLHANSGK